MTLTLKVTVGMAYFYYTRLWHKFTFTFTLFVCVLVTKRRNLTKRLSVEFFDFLVAAFTDNAHELLGATTLESVLNYDVRHFYDVGLKTFYQLATTLHYVVRGHS